MAKDKEVFISYHEASAGELVRELADRLEGAGISCWYAGRDMPIGGDFSVTVPNQIANCKVFLLIVDKGAVESEHVHTELYDAFDRYNRKEITILPLQVEDFTLTGWAHYFLRTIQVKKYPSPNGVDMGALATEIAHKLGREPVKHGNCGHGTKWKFQDGVLTISLWFGNGTMGDFYVQRVPECVNTPWWSDRERIKSVVIENGVTNIGNLAFYGCSGLASVRFPDSLASIGDGAFEGCSGLTSVRFPDSLASIGRWAFSNCPNLKSVSVPANAEIWRTFDYTTEVIRRPAK